MAGVKDYVNNKVGDNREQIEYHVEQILKLIGEDPQREGLLETPARVTRMYEEIFAGYEVDPKDVLGVTFDENHEELVIVKDIVYYSQCEHHMAPFFGKVHIGYVPSGKIAGLSKLARLVEAVTRRLQVQERITSQIADIMVEAPQPKRRDGRGGRRASVHVRARVKKPGKENGHVSCTRYLPE